MISNIQAKLVLLKKAALRFKQKLYEALSGNLCRFQQGKSTITVTKSGWVVVSDGASSDAMPVSFVRPELIAAINGELSKRGYAS